jgi:deazaflavin-dependent oxidoreductase (nitroreductase family)
VTGLQKRLFRFGNTVGVWLYRRSGGKLGGKARGGTPVLILTVKGRKSGQPFSSPAAYFERDGGWLVVGSAGGLPQEPQWFRNLRATDSAVVEVRDQRFEVGVRVLEGEERDDAFAQVVTENPGFANYETKAGRSMPVALLTPR